MKNKKMWKNAEHANDQYTEDQSGETRKCSVFTSGVNVNLFL